MYSPRIKDDQIKLLYILSKKTETPLTVLVRQAIGEYLEKHKALILEEEKSQYEGGVGKDIKTFLKGN